MEEKEKKCFVHIENYTGEKPIEIIYREDAPAKHLDPIPAKLPDCVNIEGVISTPYDWLVQRAGTIDPLNCHVKVKKEQAQIKLVVNESNKRKSLTELEMIAGKFDATDFMPRAEITGYIEYSDIYTKLHINDDTFIDPVKLSKFFRMNRVLFSNPEEAMTVVSQLKNVQAKISGSYEKDQELHGKISKTEYMSQEVTHNLPERFTLCFNIFKGSPKEKYDIEIDADVVDGRIMVQLVSPAVNDANETARDQLIDEQVKKIQELCPTLLIVEA